MKPHGGLKLSIFVSHHYKLFLSATKSGKNLQKTKSHGEPLFPWAQHQLRKKWEQNSKLEDESARKLDITTQALFEKKFNRYEWNCSAR